MGDSAVSFLCASGAVAQRCSRFLAPFVRRQGWKRRVHPFSRQHPLPVEAGNRRPCLARRGVLDLEPRSSCD